MNPYLNKNQQVTAPFALGTALPFDATVFSDIEVSGAAHTCTVTYVHIHNALISVLFRLDCTDASGNLITRTVSVADMPAHTTRKLVSADCVMLLHTGLIGAGSVLFSGLLPLSATCVHHAPANTGYTSISIEDNTYSAPTILMLLISGLVNCSLLDATLRVHYNGARPALLLCASKELSTGSGVRSINGVSGKYLSITADADITVTPVSRDTLDDATVRKIQIYSEAHGFGCS